MDALFATRVQGAESDERYTPAWVFEGLGLERLAVSGRHEGALFGRVD